MFRLFLVTSILIVIIHAETTLEDRIEKGKERHKQVVGTLVNHIFTSIEQRKEKEAAEREKLKELADQLKPYVDETKKRIKGEQELSEIDNALEEAQMHLAEEGDANAEEKQAEIARIRDEVNKAKWGLMDRLQKILHGKYKPTVETMKKSEILNEITGTSSWQSATWLLLFLCVLLSIALIAVLTHQMSKKSDYERLKNNSLM
ncbi:hypothetical protein RB195_025982 [Necator americanus]|nr:hypothetical protein NECAME_01130 [Necator americanus]ETN69020.1 hypothetical protein NECAME_01130 [Necator americanus]